MRSVLACGLGWEYKGNFFEETFWDNGDILYLVWGDDYMGIYICLSSSNCIFKMGAFYLCVSIFPLRSPHLSRKPVTRFCQALTQWARGDPEWSIQRLIFELLSSPFPLPAHSLELTLFSNLTLDSWATDFPALLVQFTSLGSIRVTQRSHLLGATD